VRRRRSRSPVVVLGVAVALAAVGAGAAQGELEQSGKLLASFNGGIKPVALPRVGKAPVAVSVRGDFKTTDGSFPDQLRQVIIGINRNGTLFDRGLPRCRRESISPASPAESLVECGGALVGRGHFSVQVDLPNQEPFPFEGTVRMFNSRGRSGTRLILAHLYGDTPPASFVLPFRIQRGRGTFGTRLVATLPNAAAKWVHVIDYDLRLKRLFKSGGRQHSYLSAGCPVPAGYPGAVFPFARVLYRFTGGKRISTTIVRNCRVR